MIIEVWVFILILFVLAAIAFGCLIVATRMSVLLEEEQSKNRVLTAENKALIKAWSHRNALDNIKEANAYNNEKEQ